MIPSERAGDRNGEDTASKVAAGKLRRVPRRRYGNEVRYYM